MATDTKTMTIAWYLREKHETTTGVVLAFERASWWIGDDDSTFEDVAPGTPGAGTMADRGEGEMTLRLDREEADRFDVGQQYAFATDLTPLYQGE